MIINSIDLKKYFLDKFRIALYFFIPFLLLFLFTHKGNEIRALKCIACTMFFTVIFSFLVEQKKEIYMPLICGLLFYVGSAGTFTLYTETLNVNWREIQYELFFSESLVCILIALSKFRNLNFLLIAIEFCVLLVAIVQITYYGYFGVSVNSDTFFIIMQTNYNEVIRLLFDNKLLFLIIVLLILSLLYLLTKYNIVHVYNEYNLRSKCYFFGIILLCILLNWIMVFKDGHLYLHRDFNLAYGYFLQVQKLRLHHNNLDVITSNDNIRNVVVIIGESANRDYMGVYGYQRNNTPWMSKMNLSSNTILFDKVYSSYRMTNKSLAYFLTESSQYNDKEVYNSLNLIDVLNASGYDTYWISNQGNISNYREVYNVIAQKSKHISFIEKGDELDEALIDLIDIPVDDKKKAIFIHLGGSHHPYLMFSNKFKVYPNDDVNDRYDNTILYTDYVLSAIFQKLKKNNPKLQ